MATGEGTGTVAATVVSFIVETGSNVVNANAYDTVANVDTYILTYHDDDTWAALGTEAKERAIMQATQYLDYTYSDRYKGLEANDNQALDWPRNGVNNMSGYYYDTDEMPQSLKDACAELALKASRSTTTLLEDQDNTAPIRSKSVKAGPVASAVEYTGSMMMGHNFRTVDRLLKHILNPTQGAVKLIRS